MGTRKFKKMVPTCIWLHILFNLVIPGVSRESKEYEACKPSRCSEDGPIITYPFYIPERGKFCGYPGFEIECNNSRTMFGKGSYLVKHIYYDSKSIELVCHEFLYKDCSAPRPFMIPPENPFLNSDSNYAELLFFYECFDASFSALTAIPINCTSMSKSISYIALITDTKQSRAYTGSVEDNPNPYQGKCHSFARVPVEIKSKTNQTIKTTDYKKLVEKGFTLKWSLLTEGSCIECQRSKGQCGRSKANQQFACYCRDGVRDRACNSGHQKLWLKIILGVVGAVMAAGVCVLIYFTCCRRKTTSLKENHLDSSSRQDLEGSKISFDVPIFSNKELEEATNNFSHSNVIGDGGFGTVYYGKLQDGREVAVKRLYNHNVQSVEQFMNEVQILTSLRHKNLVSLYGCTSRQSRELLLVYEYIANGTVADHIRGQHAEPYTLPWQVRMSIAIETAAALAYLHASGIIHRDIKTNNILLENSYRVKVADFGLSRLFPADATHVSTAPQGTPGYLDPEYHLYYQLTEKSDVYSFGVVLVQLVSSKPAVDINRERHEINLSNFAVNRIQKSAFKELIDPALGYETDSGIYRMATSVAELAFRCLQQDKEMRPSMDEVLEELLKIAYGVQMFEKIQDGEGAGSESECGASSPPSDCDEIKLLKIQHSPTSVTQKWGSISSNSSANYTHDKYILPV